MSAQINVAANNMISNSFVTFNGETKNLRNVVKSFKHTFTSYDEIAAFLKSVNKENGIACEYYDDDTVIHPFIDLDISEQPTINDLRRACNCISELFGLLEESMNTTGNTYICGRIREDIPTRLNNIICSMFKDIVPKYDQSDFKNIYNPKCNKYISMHIVFPFAACKLSKFRTFMQSYLAYKNIPFIDVSVYGNGRIFRCGNTCKYDADGHKIKNAQLFSPYNLDAEHKIYEYYSMITCFIPTAEFDCAVDNKYIIQPPEAKVIVKTIQDKPTQIKPDASILDTIKQAIPNNANLDEYLTRFKLMSCLHSMTNEEEWNEIRDLVNENRVNKMTNSYDYNWHTYDHPVYYAWKLLGLPHDQLPDQFDSIDCIEKLFNALNSGKLYNMVNKKYEEWKKNCEIASIELDEFKARQFINKTIADIADTCVKYQSAEDVFYIYGAKQFDRQKKSYAEFKKYVCDRRGDHGIMIFTFGDKKKIVTNIADAITTEGPIYHWTKNKAGDDEKYTLSLFREPRDTGKRSTGLRWLELMKSCVIEEGDDVDIKRAELSKKQWDMLIKSYAWHIQSDFQHVDKIDYLYDTCGGGTGKSMFQEGMAFMYGDMAKQLSMNIARETDTLARGALYRYRPELNDGLSKCEANAFFQSEKEAAASLISVREMHVGNKMIFNQGKTSYASNYENPNGIMNEPGMARRLMPVRFHRECEETYAEIVSLMSDPEILGGELYYILKEMDIDGYNPNKLTDDDLPNEEIVENVSTAIKVFKLLDPVHLYDVVADKLNKDSVIAHNTMKTNKKMTHAIPFKIIVDTYKSYCAREGIDTKSMMKAEQLFGQFSLTIVKNICTSTTLNTELRISNQGTRTRLTHFAKGTMVVYFNLEEVMKIMNVSNEDIIKQYNDRQAELKKNTVDLDS